MSGVSAETAYLFRHALLREGAYQLHLPADRARLHKLALALVETALGDRVDEAAPELARHAQLAQSGELQAAELRVLQRAELRWSQTALEQAKQRYDFAEQLRLAARMQQLPAATPHEVGIAIWNLGGALQHLARWDACEAEYRRLLSLAREIDELQLMSLAYRGLINFTWMVGRVDESYALCEEFLTLAPRMGDPAEIASTKALSAMMQFHLGEVGAAREAMEGVMPEVRRHCSPDVVAMESFHFGIFLQEAGELGPAREAYEDAIRLAREAGRRDIEGRVLGSYGSLRQLLGDHDAALELTRRSVEISGTVGNLRGASMQLTNLGVAYQKSGNVHEALHCFTEALEQSREFGLSDNIAFALTNVGLARIELGDLVGAIVAMRESMPIWEQMRDVAWEAYARTGLARMLRLGGEADEARQQVDRALELLKDSGSPSDELGAWLERGHQLLAAGNPPAAEQCLHESQAQLDRIGGEWVEGMRRDRDKLAAAIDAARAGEELVRGSRRESLPPALLKALES